MNQKQVLINLAAIANVLDERKAYVYADSVTQVMKRVAQQNPWWQNEAGEPMYSPEAIRAEEAYVPEPDNEFDDNPNDEYEEPPRRAPSGKFIEVISQIMNRPPGTPFLRGYTWGALDDGVAFENYDDMMKVVEILRQHPEYDVEWEDYRDRVPFEITMPHEDINNVDTNESPREDLGWDGGRED